MKTITRCAIVYLILTAIVTLISAASLKSDKQEPLRALVRQVAGIDLPPEYGSLSIPDDAKSCTNDDDCKFVL